MVVVEVGRVKLVSPVMKQLLVMEEMALKFLVPTMRVVVVVVHTTRPLLV